MIKLSVSIVVVVPLTSKSPVIVTFVNLPVVGSDSPIVVLIILPVVFPPITTCWSVDVFPIVPVILPKTVNQH